MIYWMPQYCSKAILVFSQITSCSLWGLTETLAGKHETSSSPTGKQGCLEGIKAELCMSLVHQYRKDTLERYARLMCLLIGKWESSQPSSVLCQGGAKYFLGMRAWIAWCWFIRYWRLDKIFVWPSDDVKPSAEAAPKAVWLGLSFANEGSGFISSVTSPPAGKPQWSPKMRCSEVGTETLAHCIFCTCNAGLPLAVMMAGLCCIRYDLLQALLIEVRAGFACQWYCSGEMAEAVADFQLEDVGLIFKAIFLHQLCWLVLIRLAWQQATALGHRCIPKSGLEKIDWFCDIVCLHLLCLLALPENIRKTGSCLINVQSYR